MISYHSLEKELFIGMVLLAAGVLLGLKVMLSLGGLGFRGPRRSFQRHDGQIFSNPGNSDHLFRVFISLLLLNNVTAGLVHSINRRQKAPSADQPAETPPPLASTLPPRTPSMPPGACPAALRARIGQKV